MGIDVDWHDIDVDWHDIERKNAKRIARKLRRMSLGVCPVCGKRMSRPRDLGRHLFRQHSAREREAAFFYA